MIVIQKYATMMEASFKISGGVVGGARTNTSFEGLVGKTLTFLNPTGYCTFTQPFGTNLGQLRFDDVKTQIEAAVGLSNVVVISMNNMLGFQHRTNGQAITLDAEDEPARSILGFVNGSYISGVALNGPAGAQPKYLDMVIECGSVYVAVSFSSSDKASAIAFGGSYAIAMNGARAKANG